MIVRAPLGRRVARAAAALGMLAAVLVSAPAALAAGPAITLSPSSGRPGTEVAVSGTGFAPGHSIEIRFDITPVTSTDTDATGHFDASFTVPADAVPIAHRVKAVTPSGLRASATFFVSTPWPEFGFDQGRTNANPFENVLTPRRVHTLAPEVITPKRAASSASYARGHMFAGMADGSVRSFAVASGREDWLFATGGPVRSTPAFVSSAVIGTLPAQDAVVVGSDDHRVLALSADDGTKLWKFVTGGAVRSSPLVLQDLHVTGASSGLVVVGSDDGNLYALSLKSGRKIWSAGAGGAVDSSPAFAGRVTIGGSDVPVVAVGSGDGTLRAFDVRTGAPVWSHPTGTPVVATPMVVPNASGTPDCGQIVGASTDGSVFGLNCATGAVLWSVDVGAGVVGSPGLSTCPSLPGAGACQKVVIGTKAGKLWIWDVTDPAHPHSINLSAPIRSSPAIGAGIAWVHTSSDAATRGALHAVEIATRHAIARFPLSTEPPLEASAAAIGMSSSPILANALVLLPQVKFNTHSEWPQFHPDATNRRSQLEWKLGTFSVGGLHHKWSSTQLAGEIFSSPAVAKGIVYVGSNRSLYAFKASCSNPCSPLWVGQTFGEIRSSPAVANGVVYVGSDDGRLYAFPASCSFVCQPLWHGETAGPVSSSPAVANGVVYVGSEDHVLYAFPGACSNPCLPLWSGATAGQIYSSPAVANGVVYIAGGSKLYAFPTSCSGTCLPLWRGLTEFRISGSPTAWSGTVYIGSEDGFLYAFPASCSDPCSPLWKSEFLSDFLAATPAVANGVVYEGDRGKLYAFPTSCSTPCAPLWQGTLPVGSLSTSPAYANGVVYAGSHANFGDVGAVSAFPASCSNPCSPLRSITFGSNVFTSPTVADGKLYVGAADRFLYVFGL
jgi:outer membrane protein assembly factor BamB